MRMQLVHNNTLSCSVLVDACGSMPLWSDGPISCFALSNTASLRNYFGNIVSGIFMELSGII